MVISGGKDSTADGSGSQEGTAGGPTDGQEDSASSGNSPEVGNRGPDDGGVDAGSDPDQAGPIRATFTKGKARLKVVARAIADADQQTSSNAENATERSEYRLAVKLR